MTMKSSLFASLAKSKYLRRRGDIHLLLRGVCAATHYLSVGHGTIVADGMLRETIVNQSNLEIIGETFEVSVTVSEDDNTVTLVVDLGKYVLRETWRRVE